MNNEGALIVFTLLIHLAVGASLFYALLAFSWKDGIAALPSGINRKTPELILLIVVAIALAASFLHLGKPGHATNALNNLASSWISREILGVAIFALSLVLLLIGRRQLKGKQNVVNVLFFFVEISGVILISVMTRLYMIPTVVTWHTWMTPVGFVLHTLILGLSGVLLYAVLFKINNSLIRSLILWLSAFLLIELVVSGLFQKMLNEVSISHDNHLIKEGILLKITIFRGIIIASSLVFLTYFRRKTKVQGMQPLLVALMVLTLLLIFFGQGLGKFVFYAGYVRIGI